MTTLYAFGCSNTYGAGLPDCWRPNTLQPEASSFGTTPSAWAWPQHTSRLLRCECENLGIPGASNKLILHRILNTRYTTGCQVAVCWSYPNRDTIFTTLELEDLLELDPYNKQEHKKMLALGTWKLNRELCHSTEEYKANRAYYKHIYNEQDSWIDSWQYLHTADLHLKSLGITAVHSVCHPRPEQFLNSRPRYITATVLKHSMETISVDKPKALDGRHPGEHAHELYGKLVARALQVLKA